VTKDDDDIVRVVLRAALAAGALSRDEAARIDRQVRDSHGGARYYVPRRPSEGKGASLAAAVATGTSISTAIDALGISDRWGRALLDRRWVIRW
jgi:hypothetical protein